MRRIHVAYGAIDNIYMHSSSNRLGMLLKTPPITAWRTRTPPLPTTRGNQKKKTTYDAKNAGLQIDSRNETRNDFLFCTSVPRPLVLTLLLHIC